jgi:hypothetical protein
MMETPRTPRIQDLEYQALQDNAKRLQEQKEQDEKREQQEQRENRERESLFLSRKDAYFVPPPFQNNPNKVEVFMVRV